MKTVFIFLFVLLMSCKHRETTMYKIEETINLKDGSVNPSYYTTDKSIYLKQQADFKFEDSIYNSIKK